MYLSKLLGSLYGLVIEPTELLKENTGNEWAEEIKARQYYMAAQEAKPSKKTIAVLHEALSLIIEKAERAALPLQNNLPSLNNRSIPRHIYLAQMHKFLFHSVQAVYPALFLVGESGTGKSTLGQIFAHANANAYPGGIFLIDGGSINDLYYLPSALLESMGEELTTADLFDAQLVNAKLNKALGGRGRILVLVDQVKQVEWLKSPAKLKDKFRADADIHWILMTNILQGYVKNQGFEYLRIENFTEKEALNLLDIYRPIITEQDQIEAKELLKIIGLKPLAVMVLGAFLFANPEEKREILEWTTAKENFERLFADLVYGLTGIEQKVLENASYLPNDGVKLEWLYEFELYYTSHLRGLKKDTMAVWHEAFNHLKMLGIFKEEQGGLYALPEKLAQVLKNRFINTTKELAYGEFLQTQVEKATRDELPTIAQMVFKFVKSQNFLKLERLFNLIDCLEKFHSTEIALKITNECLQFLSYFSEVNKSRIYFRHSVILSYSNKKNESLIFVNKCIAIEEKLDPKRESYFLAILYNFKANIYKFLRQFNEALAAINQHIKILENIDTEKKSNELAGAYASKSSILSVLNKSTEAYAYLNQAIQIQENLDLDGSLSGFYQEMSMYYYDLNSYYEAFTFINQAIIIAKRLGENRQPYNFWKAKIITAMVNPEISGHEEFKYNMDYYIKLNYDSFDLIKELEVVNLIIKTLEIEKKSIILGLSYSYKAVLLNELGKDQEALSYVNQSITIQEALDLEKKSCSLAISYYYKVQILIALGANKEALELVKKVIKYHEALDLKMKIRWLLVFYGLKAEVLDNLNEHENALIVINQVINNHENLDTEKKDRDLTVSYYLKAKILNALNENIEALTFVNKAISIEMTLDTEKKGRYLGVYYFRKALILKSHDEIQEAKEFNTKALAILENYKTNKFYQMALDLKKELNS